MKRIGLTGGIGSGKSTLAGMLAEMGAPVLDLDALGRELHHDADCRAALVTAFGRGILNAAGEVDRTELGRLCFADAGRTAQLNSIMHPRIWQRERDWLAHQHAPYVLIEASVLIESGGAARMDAVVVVMADEQLRRRRVLARAGIDEERFAAIVSRQCDDAMRLAVADITVDNNGGLDALRQRAFELHHRLLAMEQA